MAEREPVETRWLVEPAELWRRVLVLSLGYCAAVLAATAATVTHLGLPSLLPDDGAWGSFGSFLQEWTGLLLGGLTLTAPFGLPGFLLALAVAYLSGCRDRLFFVFAGGLNAFLALGLSGMTGEGMMLDGPFFVFSCFGGGLAGGYAHWLVAEVWQPPRRILSRPAALSAPAP